MTKEIVYCIQRNKLPAEWLGEFTAIGLDIYNIDTLLKGNCFWADRGDSETDPELKQIIPYVLTVNPMGRIAVYQRCGNEKRLREYWSAGVGGHINPIDQSSSLDKPSSIIQNGALRELHEEFKLPVVSHLLFLGAINEELSEVGRSHWGCVFKAVLSNLPTGSNELFNLKWCQMDEISGMKTEHWTKLAIKLLNNAD